jgi:hypothetical protein
MQGYECIAERKHAIKWALLVGIFLTLLIAQQVTQVEDDYRHLDLRRKMNRSITCRY